MARYPNNTQAFFAGAGEGLSQSIPGAMQMYLKGKQDDKDWQRKLSAMAAEKAQAALDATGLANDKQFYDTLHDQTVYGNMTPGDETTFMNMGRQRTGQLNQDFHNPGSDLMQAVNGPNVVPPLGPGQDIPLGPAPYQSGATSPTAQTQETYRLAKVLQEQMKAVRPAATKTTAPFDPYKARNDAFAKGDSESVAEQTAMEKFGAGDPNSPYAQKLKLARARNTTMDWVGRWFSGTGANPTEQKAREVLKERFDPVAFRTATQHAANTSATAPTNDTPHALPGSFN